MSKKTFSLMLGLILLLSTTVFVTVQEATIATRLSPGIVFEVETTDHEQSPPRVGSMEIIVEGPNLAIPIMAGSGRGSGGNGKMIFRGDKGKNGEVVIVDDDKKTYYVMGDATAKAVAGQLGAVAGAMDAMIKNLPKEQRDAIEKAIKQGKEPTKEHDTEKARQEGAVEEAGEAGMAAGMGAAMGASSMKAGGKSEVKKTGERGKKVGYPCVKYEVWQDGRKIREIWTTDWDNIDGGDEAEKAFKGLGTFFEAFWKAMPQMPGGQDPFGGQNPFEEMNFGNGFPVVVTGFDEDGNIEDESWLKRTRRQRIDPDAFEPPSGYKRMSLGPQ